MILTNLQLQKLRQALLDAFLTPSDLRLLVWHHLDIRLEIVTTRDSLELQVFDLVEWARAHERLELLIRGAYTERPGNPRVRDFVVESGLDQLVDEVAVTAALGALSPLPFQDPARSVDRTRLREVLHETYSRGALEILCRNLGISYSDLPGDTLELKILRLVDRFWTRGELEHLVARVLQDYPHLADKLR